MGDWRRLSAKAKGTPCHWVKRLLVGTLMKHCRNRQAKQGGCALSNDWVGAAKIEGDSLSHWFRWYAFLKATACARAGVLDMTHVTHGRGLVKNMCIKSFMDNVSSRKFEEELRPFVLDHHANFPLRSKNRVHNNALGTHASGSQHHIQKQKACVCSKTTKGGDQG